jgi:hypothetical protein
MFQFFKYVIKTFSLVLIIPIINYSTNYHSSENFNERFVKDLIINDSLSINKDVLQLEIVKKRIVKIKSRDTKRQAFVLGSSRSMMLGKPIDRNVENLSLSGSRLVDMKNIYGFLKEKKVKIDTLYIEVSPWLLYSTEAVHKNWNNSTRSFLRTVKKMFSWKYFIENLNPFKYGLVKSNDDFIVYSDGTIKYPLKIRQKNNIDNIINYAKGEVYNLSGFDSLEKIDSLSFDNFITEIKNDGVFIYLLKQPYPPLINSKILNKYPLIKKTDLLVDKTAYLFNIEILGSFYPEKAGLLDSDFYDGMHLTPEGLKKLLQLNLKTKPLNLR